MKYDIVPTPPFAKEIRRLAKKYPSLKSEIINVLSILSSNPQYGTAIGNDCYKIRIAIKSKNTGKSGGARMITFVHVAGQSIFLLSIYDKSEAKR